MKRINFSRKRAVSGFTLLEVVIVMGIISILLGVLIPTMRTYMTKSRLNTANSNAKVIFNSLQTIMQEYEFEERGEELSMFYGNQKRGNIQLYGINGTIQMGSLIVHNGSGSTPVDNSANPISLSDADIGATLAGVSPRTIGARMSRLYPDYEAVTWCALIRNYSVVGVLCATSVSSPYIGGYPLQIQERRIGITTDSGAVITASTLPAAVATSDLGSSVLAAYCTEAWKTSAGMSPMVY